MGDPQQNVPKEEKATKETTTETKETETKETEKKEQDKNDKKSKAEKKAEKKAKDIADYNKTTAWLAVDTYCRNTKGWNATDFSKDRVIVKDSQYYVYVTRNMIDGSEGTFLYILKPYGKPDSEGRYDQYTMVEEKGQVFEYIK